MPSLRALMPLIVLLLLACLPSVAVAGTVTGELKKWHTVTVDFVGPLHDEMDTNPNPFLDYRLQVTFSGPSGVSYEVPGFFDGDGNGGGNGSVWRVRFAPDEAGTWSYSAAFRSGTDVAVSLSSSAGSSASFDGDSGSFVVAGLDPNADGFLKYGRLESIGSYYFKFRDGDYWIKGGMDSPENILGYNGFDNTPFARLDYVAHVQDWQLGDPDWDSTNTAGVPEDGRGIIGMLNYLASQNLNSIYFMPMNIGADGKDTWPFASATIDRNGSPSNDDKHYDISKLQQWAITLDHAQRNEIFLHFVLSDREPANKNELDNATLGVERKLFYREMVARFGHHNALQWNISEEYNLALPLDPNVIKEFAQYITDIDPYGHPVTVHPHGNTYKNALAPFIGDPRFGVMSVQTWQRPDDIGSAIEWFRKETAQAGQIVPTAVDESIGLDQLSQDVYRQRAIWDAMLSGGGHELFVRYQDSSLDDFRQFETHYQNLWYARKFVIENLPFWEMTPSDSLVSGENGIYGGAEVFAKVGEVYAVYLPATDLPAVLSLSGLSGSYTQRWYNPRTGQFEGTPIVINAVADIQLGSPPSGAGQDWAILITSNASGGNSGTFTQSTAGDGLVSMEAESFLNNSAQGGHAWSPTGPGGQSGAAAMEALPNSGVNRNSDYVANSPRMDYEVDFTETGIHYVWIRGIGATSKDDSVHVGLDGAAVSTADRITIFNPSWTWSNMTMDSGSAAVINITTPGVHTINVWMREDGFVIDKIVLTTDSTLDPGLVYGPLGPPESGQGLPALPVPVISPASGTYFGSVDVTIAADPGAAIYYTTDGAAPTTASLLYGGSFLVTSDATVQAIAVQTGWSDSAVASASYVISTVLQPPTISPAGGAFLNSVTVSITSAAVPGSAIYYTLDGTTPTTASLLYTGAIVLTADTTVTAITVLSGFTDSAPAQEIYTIVTSGGGSGVFLQSTSGDGLVSMEAENYQFEIANGGHAWTATLPGGQSGVSAMEATPNLTVNRNSDYVANSPRMDYDIEFTETGTHYVWIRGIGATSKDDSLHVGLDGAAVSTADRITIFNPSWTWSNTTMDAGSAARINVTTPGVHTLNVWMREDGFVIDKIVLTTDSTLNPSVVYGPQGPTESGQGLPSLALPMISPTGGTYFGSADVTITADPGAAIYYTTDGTTPTTASLLYGGQFSVTSDATVQAIAVQTGWSDSAVASASYVISTVLQPPTISPAGGAFLNSVTVSITSAAVPGSAIYYTTDGTTPTTASLLYTGAIVLTADATVKAITALSGFTDSVPAQEIYTVVTSGGGSGVYLQSTSGDGLVSMEAENYQFEIANGGHAWTVTVPGGQSGVSAMEATPNLTVNRKTDYVANSPRMDYDIEFTEIGTHYVWIRGIGASGTDDSLHVGLDGAAVTTADKISFFNPSWTWSNTTLDSGSAARINITTPGVHTLNVWMREDGFVIDKIVLTTDSTLNPSVVYGPEGPTESDQGLPSLPVPVISPASGTYFGSVDVTIAADPGAAVYYTTDGTTPTTASLLYGGQFSLTSDATVQAIAVQSGLNDSAVASASYVISTELQPPTISPAGGAFLNSVTVSMTTAAPPGSAIYYTTDGTTPTTASLLYTGTIVLTADATVQAITALSGFTDSVPAQEIYTVVTSGGGNGVFLQSTTGDGLVSMEAENYQFEIANGGHAWTGTVPGGQSGTSAMEATPNSGVNRKTDYVANSPRMDYDISFTETGTHYVWIRGIGASGTDDSLHVGLNGTAVNTADKISIFNPSWTWSNTTLDSGSIARIDVTTPGVHTLNVWMREDGFVIDKIVLTTDSTLDPSVVYGPEGPPQSQQGVAPPLTPPAITPAGGTFLTSLTVSITAVSANSVIRYTTDGSDPTASSPIYLTPFVVSADTVVKAIATRNGYDDSAAATALFSQTSCQNVRIMALGDSITDGKNASSAPPVGLRVSYRRELYFKMVENGTNVDFVGSINDGSLALPAFDADHEGHPGFNAAQIASGIYGWLVANPADFVLLHIGTNDLTTSTTDVEAILDEIDRYDPAVHVVLAKIINRQSYSQNTTKFNNNLDTMAQARISAGDLITVIDMESALSYPDDLADNLHPNPSGYSKMSDAWFNDLVTVVPACAAP